MESALLHNRKVNHLRRVHTVLGKFGHGALSRFKKKVVSLGLSPREMDEIIPSHIRAAGPTADEPVPVVPTEPKTLALGLVHPWSPVVGTATGRPRLTHVPKRVRKRTFKVSVVPSAELGGWDLHSRGRGNADPGEDLRSRRLRGW